MDKLMDWQALRNRIALNLTSVACRLSAVPRHPVTVMGLEFPTPLGIAAGFDRHGALGRRVASLGFGFNEIGSLTAFGDIAWAGLRGDFNGDDLLYGIGVGASLLDGLVRFDVSQGLTGPTKQFRVDLYLDALL